MLTIKTSVVSTITGLSTALLPILIILEKKPGKFMLVSLLMHLPALVDPNC